MFSPHKSFASTYHRVHVETGVDSADPHRLVGMLFDGVLAAISGARGALARRDLATKGEQIGRAVRILEEGLRSGLDHAVGGALARNLDQVYAYAVRRLTQANLRNDDALLRECTELLTPLRDAWRSIGAPAAQE